jgi:hypothetical protein
MQSEMFAPGGKLVTVIETDCPADAELGLKLRVGGVVLEGAEGLVALGCGMLVLVAAGTFVGTVVGCAVEVDVGKGSLVADAGAACCVGATD